MFEVQNLEKGTLFTWDNDLYYKHENEYDGDNNLINCTCRKIGFKSGSIWIFTLSDDDTNFNPYCSVKLVQVSI